MMVEEYVAERITQLRMQKNVSERKMSLGLGYSGGYIHSITSQRNVPSLESLETICGYFEISLSDFFNPEYHNQKDVNRLNGKLEELSDSDLHLVEMIVDRIQLGKQSP